MTQRQPANPALARLDPLIGEWAIEATVAGETMIGGRASFAWIMDGKFLAQHTDGDPADGAAPDWVANSPMPTDAIIGSRLPPAVHGDPWGQRQHREREMGGVGRRLDLEARLRSDVYEADVARNLCGGERVRDV